MTPIAAAPASSPDAADARKDLILFRSAFAVTFILLGVLLNAFLARYGVLLFVLLLMGAFDGPAPALLLLAYPAVLVVAGIVAKTGPRRPLARGVFFGAAWGLIADALTLVAVMFLPS